ncbi:MAG: triple tyrosine motif-containing protein [Kangiellaceae bacterium]|nr:triple tyrosine motif-containing protein [Kangiellaceae bacterium]MCW9015553.1 triple tyrosine motif-containing protein [Kangiellaceae bacterium]
MCNYLFGMLRLTLVVIACAAQASEPVSSPLRFDHYSLNQGLSQGTVTCMLQDRQGFIWIGTQDGLNRFDGYSFKVFSHDSEDDSTLSSSFIDALYEDSNGILWVGTSKGLNRFDRKQEVFTHYKLAEEKREYIGSQFVKELYPGPGNNILVATLGGLFSFDPVSKSTKHFVHDAENPESIVSNKVYAMLSDKPNQFWVGTEQGLERLDYSNGSFKRFQYNLKNKQHLGKLNVTALAQDKSGRIWIGTYNTGLYRLNPKSGEVKRFRHSADNTSSLGHNRVRSLLVSEAGEIWVGTRGGINLYSEKNDNFSHYRHDPAIQSSLNNDNVWSMAEDSNGGIWFGTSDGVSRFDPRTRLFGHHHKTSSLNHTLSHKVVRSLHKAEDGIIWIGVDNGLNRYDPVSGEYQHFIHDPNDANSISRGMVMSILVDSKGRTWAGTYDGGLNLYIPKSGTFKRFAHDPNSINSISSDRVYSIKEGRGGGIWVGTVNGLNLFNPETGAFKRFQHDPLDPYSISDNGVYATYLAETDREEPDYGETEYLWVATRNGGLNRLNLGSYQFERFTHDANNKNSISHNRLFALYIDPQGVVWSATKSGLSKHIPNSGIFTSYGKKHGLANDTVYAVAGDEQGDIWVSTNRGLARFDPKAETFKNYDESQGVQSNEFNNGAFFRAKDGELFFGGINGFNRFYPSNIQPDTSPPKLAITELLLFNKVPELMRLNSQSPLYSPINEMRNLSLGYRDYVFSFEFSGLHFSNPLLNRYRYRLEGFDNDWIETDAMNRRATYTNLPSGSYTFHVKASNADGIWSPLSKRISVEVQPAPWKTWWAYSLYLLIMVIILGSFIRVKLQQLAIERRTARAIAQSEKRLSTALWGSRCEMWQWNMRIGKVERDNLLPDIVKLSGAATSPNDFIDLIHEDDRAAFVYALNEHLGGKSKFLEATYRLKTKGNDWRWILDRGQVVERDQGGNPVVMCGTLSDISDLKEAELNRVQSLRKLVTGIAHEINTPLGISVTAISLVNSELVQLLHSATRGELGIGTDKLNQDIGEGCQLVEKNLGKMSNLIAELRKVAEYSGTRSYAFQLSELLDECMTQFRSYDSPLVLELKVTCSSDILVLGEPLILKQVLETLFDNSLEHGFRQRDCGQILISATTHQGKVILTFSDNGCGMVESDLDEAFEPFFTTRRIEHHIGLGLHTAHSLVVNELQGAISIKNNRSGEGIRVTIELKSA